MRGFTIAVFLLVVGVAVAYPSQWGRSSRSRSRAESEEGFYPSGRGRPISRRPSGPPQSWSPYYIDRSPRYVNTVPVSEEQGQRLVLNRLRDDDDDDSDEDDVQDDEGGDDDDDDVQDDEFDTPTWDELFPKKEQGSYGQANGGGSAGGPPPPQAQGQGFSIGGGGAPEIQQDSGSYEIQADGPGGANWGGGVESLGGQGRAQFVPMRSMGQKRYRPVMVRVARPRPTSSRGYEMMPMKKSSKHGQGPRWVVKSQQSQPQQWWYPQQQYVSSPNRRWSQPQPKQYQSQRDGYWAYPRRNVWSGRQRRNNKSWGHY